MQQNDRTLVRGERAAAAHKALPAPACPPCRACLPCLPPAPPLLCLCPRSLCPTCLPPLLLCPLPILLIVRGLLCCACVFMCMCGVLCAACGMMHAALCRACLWRLCLCLIVFAPVLFNASVLTPDPQGLSNEVHSATAAHFLTWRLPVRLLHADGRAI